MYAMLVGKLPFRSPRQGTKKRQKLLEQIQAGLTDSREKDMSHVTMEGRDLIGGYTCGEHLVYSGTSLIRTP